MTRVIVHAGFHKTGTTSLQAYLERNREALAPYAQIYLKTQLKRARYLGRWYGQRPVFWRRWLFRRGFRDFLDTVGDAPVIFISRESFSGMMPGFRGGGLRRRLSYAPMAVPLAREIVRGLRRRFGQDVEIEFLYTIRDGEAFVKSAWAHVLRTTRLRMDLDAFRAMFGTPPDLAAEAERIARAVGPVPVHIAPLESFAESRFGPAEAALDLLGVPAELRARLPDATRNNPGQSDALSREFLAMNRGKSRGRALYTAKEALVMAERPADLRRKPRYGTSGE